MKRIIAAPGVAPTLFPPPQLASFFGYLRAVWGVLAAAPPRWWGSRKETVLVAGLFTALDDDESQMTHGLGFGHFIYEASRIVINPGTGMPKTVGRTDVQFAHGSPWGPKLTIEFKRLDNRSPLRGLYFRDGVARFVSGQYCPEHDEALMVGLVDGSAALEKAALLRYLRRGAAKTALRLLPMSHSHYGDPSLHSPHVDFDTMHDRAPSCSAPIIKIGHILLER